MEVLSFWCCSKGSRGGESGRRGGQGRGRSRRRSGRRSVSIVITVVIIILIFIIIVIKLAIAIFQCLSRTGESRTGQSRIAQSGIAKVELVKEPVQCWALVMPEGPAAAPLRAVLRLRPNLASSNSNSETGAWCTMLSGNGSRNCAGLRLKATRVSKFSAANSAPSRACRAEESSPNWASMKALSPLLASLSVTRRLWRLLALPNSSAHWTPNRNNSCHCPFENI